MGLTKEDCDLLVEAAAAQGYVISQQKGQHVNDRARLILKEWAEAREPEASIASADYNTMCGEAMQILSGEDLAGMSWNDKMLQGIKDVKDNPPPSGGGGAGPEKVPAARNVYRATAAVSPKYYAVYGATDA